MCDRRAGRGRGSAELRGCVLRLVGHSGECPDKRSCCAFHRNAECAAIAPAHLAESGAECIAERAPLRVAIVGVDAFTFGGAIADSDDSCERGSILLAHIKPRSDAHCNTIRISLLGGKHNAHISAELRS